MPNLYDEAEPADPTDDGSETVGPPDDGPSQDDLGERPEPGTSLTASVETIDNDQSDDLTFSANLIR